SGIHQAPGEGLEPPRRWRLINSEVRLPFRHPGIKRAKSTTVTQYERIRENLTTENTEITEGNQREERPFEKSTQTHQNVYCNYINNNICLILPGYHCAIGLFCCLSFPSSVVSVVKLFHLHKALWFCARHTAVEEASRGGWARTSGFLLPKQAD